ncbi:MAG: OmpA family protein [Verrucomicrobiota bacterium]
MSKLYDDLRREDGNGPPDEGDHGLDLFAFAKAKYGEETVPPVPSREEPPATGEDALESDPPPVPGPDSPEPPLPDLPLPGAPLPDTPLSEPLPEQPAPEEPPPEKPPARPAPRFEGALYSGLSPLTDVGSKKHALRRPSSHALTVAAVFGVIAMGVLAIGVIRAAYRGSVKRGPAASRAVAQAQPPAAKPVAAPARAPGPVAAPKPAAAPKIAPARPPPEKPVVKPVIRPAAPAVKLEAPGARVTVEGSEKVVMFESGLFVSGYTLSREGEDVLLKLAQQLAPHRTNLFITVIGCTDNVPIRTKKEYKNNEDLGLFRALAVVRFLQLKTGMPESSFKMITYGTKWSPYPNDTADNRTRNRTVVLRIAAR